jgi:hypothetical protein
MIYMLNFLPGGVMDGDVPPAGEQSENKMKLVRLGF